MSKLISAVALSHSRQVTTKYGQKTVIDAIRSDNGEKITVWRGGNDEYSQKYVIPNSPLTLTLNSKGKYDLVESVPSLKKPENPTEIGLSPNQKREISAYVEEMAKLYQFCLDQAEPIALDVTDARAIATTLFISAQRKFSL